MYFLLKLYSHQIKWNTLNLKHIKLKGTEAVCFEIPLPTRCQWGAAGRRTESADTVDEGGRRRGWASGRRWPCQPWLPLAGARQPEDFGEEAGPRGTWKETICGPSLRGCAGLDDGPLARLLFSALRPHCEIIGLIFLVSIRFLRVFRKVWRVELCASNKNNRAFFYISRVLLVSMDVLKGKINKCSTGAISSCTDTISLGAFIGS